MVLLLLTAPAPAAEPESATLKVRGSLVEWKSRHRYLEIPHLVVRIDGRVPMEEVFTSGGDACGAYYYLRGVSVRLNACSPGRRSPSRLRVRARGTGPSEHTVTVRFAGRRG